MIRLYIIRIIFYVLDVGLKDGTSRLLAMFHKHNVSLLSSLFTPKETITMPPQIITDDLAALESAATGATTLHAFLNNLTDEQATLLNQVADATQKMKDGDAAQKAALDKTIADIQAAYGVKAAAPMMMALAPGAEVVGDQPAPEPVPPPPHVGPFRALWAWVVANPDKALKVLSWLALLFGIPLPVLKSQIEALPRKS